MSVHRDAEILTKNNTEYLAHTTCVKLPGKAGRSEVGAEQTYF